MGEPSRPLAKATAIRFCGRCSQRASPRLTRPNGRSCRFRWRIALTSLRTRWPAGGPTYTDRPTQATSDGSCAPKAGRPPLVIARHRWLSVRTLLGRILFGTPVRHLPSAPKEPGNSRRETRFTSFGIKRQAMRSAAHSNSGVCKGCASARCGCRQRGSGSCGADEPGNAATIFGKT